MKKPSSRLSLATRRALARVKSGERPTHAANAEGINSSTLWRALAKDRPLKLYLLVTDEEGALLAWVQDQRRKRVGQTHRFDTVEQLQAALPKFFVS